MTMDTPFATSITVPRRVQSVRRAAAFLVNAARALQVPAAAGSLFENAIVEALNNAIEHNGPASDTPLQCELELRERVLIVRVLDEAARAPVALTMLSGGTPADPGTWQDVPESGYGLYLIKSVFPDVRPVTRDGRHGIEMQLTF